MKAMMRDKIGSFMSRSECEDFLTRWVLQYVVGNDNVAAEVKARKPLRDAKVEVVEVPGKPGVYRAVAFLKPHFQLDELSVSLRLVAELPKGAK
jgi:type VI secretion system protein ImpC